MRKRTYLLACLTWLGLALPALPQQLPNVGQTQTTTAKIPSALATSTTAISATQSPVSLVESQIVQAQLDVTSSEPARFFFAGDLQNPSAPLYVAASLCTGPGIPPYNVSDPNVLKQLDLKYYDAEMITLPSMYISTDTANQQPGPTNLQGEPDIVHFYGGLAYDVNTDKTRDGVWISIFPPKDSRNVTGTWSFLLGLSTEVAPIALRQDQGLLFADSDRTNALLNTYNSSQGISPNLTMAILPTTGMHSLPDAYYFNSSVCAVSAAFQAFNATTNANRPVYNRTDTMRYSVYDNTSRVQWQISDLSPATNYTAWLIDVGETPQGLIASSTMWPAIKFVTKQSPNCRLVYDVDFCPSVAYSIPINPTIPTEQALTVINQTVQANFANFSATLATFPCGSREFGQFSPLKTCQDCSRAYQDWLCAVTMPRCTDPLAVMDNQTTAAEPNPFALLGTATPLNTELLPYIINRNGDSRQSYIDSPNGLDAGEYGELLPCLQTCYSVASSCPQPLIQWYCPLWDITAQTSYGTFADAGAHGVGFGENGGAGQDGQRFGGPTQFVAQDSFGTVFCNSMNVDRQLLLANSATTGAAGGRGVTTFALLAMLSTLIALAI